jgi:hypothetical protein
MRRLGLDIRLQDPPSMLIAVRPVRRLSAAEMLRLRRCQRLESESVPKIQDRIICQLRRSTCALDGGMIVMDSSKTEAELY